VAELQILIADDHASIRRGIRSLLESHAGWSVVAEAANGREAIEQAARLKPDVIVLDVSMPEVDGLQAMRQILRNDPSACIVILTIHDSDALKTQASTAGARRVVSKADAQETLIAAIESVTREPARLAGTSVGRHYHIGAFFHSAAERDRVLIPFTQEGLSRGEKIIHIVDASASAAEPHSPEIDFVSADEVYLRDGAFDGHSTEAIHQLLCGAMDAAPATRLIGYVRPNDHRIIEYETRIHDMMRPLNAVVICVYDLSSFSSDIIIDAFRVHPAVLIDDTFRENPFYVPPDAMLTELKNRAF
jgi:DNA-binding NarL/FixJ family response regulator